MNRLAWLILIAWVCIGALVFIKLPYLRNVKVEIPKIVQGDKTIDVRYECTQKEADSILNGVVEEIIKHKTVTFMSNGQKYVYKKENQ